MYDIDNFCVICGERIPEGRMVCINCELAGAKHTEKKKPHHRASSNHKYDVRKKRRDKQKQKDLYMNEYKEE